MSLEEYFNEYMNSYGHLCLLTGFGHVIVDILLFVSRNKRRKYRKPDIYQFENGKTLNNTESSYQFGLYCAEAAGAIVLVLYSVSSLLYCCCIELLLYESVG